MDFDKTLISTLEERAGTIRYDVIKMLTMAKLGHPGGSLSRADIVAVLYFHVMRHDPLFPARPERDRFLIAKGHCAATWYATLARAGYFPTQWLDSLRKIDSPLQGHPDMLKTPGKAVPK
jgi:transketolase